MRIALAVEYDGSAFCGWQRQPHSPSVQQELEQSLARIACAPITVHCSGRTDTGVHAMAQVVHFDTEVVRPLTAWTFGVNTHLCRAVAVHWAQLMPADFHARFTALNRSYRYTLLNRSTRPALGADRLAWVNKPLDAQSMHTAAQVLVGQHDFSSFRSADCQANHAKRDLQMIRVTRAGNLLTVEVTANGFLHNMVRILVGCLICIGKGEKSSQWLSQLLAARDRTQAAMTAPAQGLCFLQPRYPTEYSVPDFQQNDHWRGVE